MTRSQPKRGQRPEDDLERLSAYIDNQLSPAERRELEQRLAQEPQLQTVLAELRSTVYVLGELDPLLPPRSFTLDARMLSKPMPAPKPSFWAQWFQPLSNFGGALQLGSGLTGLALVLLATVQLLAVGTTPVSMTSAPMPAQALSATDAVALEAAPAPEAEVFGTISNGMTDPAAAPSPDDAMRGAGQPDDVGPAAASAPVPAADAPQSAPPPNPGPNLGAVLLLVCGLGLLGFAVGWGAYSRSRGMGDGG